VPNSLTSMQESFPIAPPPEPPPLHEHGDGQASHEHITSLLHSESVQVRGDNVLRNNFLFECESSVEGDTFEDIDNEGSLEGGDLDDLLKWPLEMLIAPTMRRRKCRQRNDGEAPTARNADSPSREGKQRVGKAGGLWGRRDRAGRARWKQVGWGIPCHCSPGPGRGASWEGGLGGWVRGRPGMGFGRWVREAL
jgi:hypothetical protein